MLNEIIIPVSAAIVIGCIVTIAKHITNDKKHPDKAEIVFKDVCDIKHKGLEDCFESKISALNDKVETFRLDVKTEFAEVKDLIRKK